MPPKKEPLRGGAGERPREKMIDAWNGGSKKSSEGWGRPVVERNPTQIRKGKKKRVR